VANVPARLIKEFRKKHEDRPVLKGAFIQEDCYVGDNQLEALATLKSKEELVGDIIALLQSPAKNVISALKGSAGQKVAGIVKALEERGA
jgi:large subunit ribosomal protein L10